MIHGKRLSQWCQEYPLLNNLTALKETSWFNANITSFAEALPYVTLTEADVDDASARLERFAPYLAQAFPETRENQGIIESPCKAIVAMQGALEQYYQTTLSGKLWLKMDSHLPISGSIKARGGIYEVLYHAESLAIQAELLSLNDDYTKLDSERLRRFFSRHTITVGSTGNLGLSIGIMSARLGFKATVHMSADARQWKKDMLRAYGVSVVEYFSDYSKAVEEGRRQAENDPYCHFVDDEHSVTLFLGYAVAARRLQTQFAEAGVIVDKDHPLFVYLPCGVGGGPGGVAFGLKLAFKDNVHCIFAEPTHSPCMFMGVYTGLHDRMSVQDFGIDNITAADGLAVGRPSGFVGKSMQRMLDGYYTISDDRMYQLLALMDKTEGIQLEPSALASLPGIMWVQTEAQGYRTRMGFSREQLANAIHLAWATGGNMVPADIMQGYIRKGVDLLNADGWPD